MDYAREIDGRTRYFAMSIYPIRSGGEIIGSSEFTREITERVHAEESLRASEARFRLAFENANVGVCLVGLDRRLLRVNERFCTMLGYERHELEGLTIDEITHPDYVAASTAFIQRATVCDRDDIEKVYLHRDGRHVWGRVNRSLVRDGEGKPLYYIAHVQDITERKQAEAEREQLQEQLLQAQKMEAIGRLAGGIAHDFNNMLAVILLRAEMSLPLAGGSTPLHYNLSSIYSTAQRSADLVRQLLGFAAQTGNCPQVARLERHHRGRVANAAITRRRRSHADMAARGRALARQDGSIADRPDSHQPVLQRARRDRRRRDNQDRNGKCGAGRSNA